MEIFTQYLTLENAGIASAIYGGIFYILPKRWREKISFGVDLLIKLADFLDKVKKSKGGFTLEKDRE